MPTDPTSFSLRDKVIVQFGGTGLLGRALVRSLDAAGATLVVATRSRASMAPIVAAEAAAGHAVLVDEVDIGAEGSILALRERLLAAHGRVDGIVFNAVTRTMRSAADPIANWEASMAINSTGLFATVRAFGDVMAAKRAGSIVNIASMYGTVGMNPMLYEGTTMSAAPDYFFHKAGMINLTRWLAAHYGPQGVRVNVVSPGGIYNTAKPQAPQFLERYNKLTAFGRMADAAEIGGAVVFLLSDASTYVTGINLPVDGGYTAR